MTWYPGKCAANTYDFAWFSHEELVKLTYEFGQGEIIALYLRKKADKENCLPQFGRQPESQRSR